MKSEWCKISLFFLFLVALIGTLLRSLVFIPTLLEYENLVHAHSHVAFQGWVYTIMILLLTNAYLTKEKIENGHYPLQYKLTVLIVLGVLLSFSLQGYAFYSIIFSTLFQLLFFWFACRFLKDTRYINSSNGETISLRFVRTGLWLGLVSTILPFGIGIFAAKGLKGTQAYQTLIYTFLHLQYNGWFLFVVLGLFFNFLHNNNIYYNQKSVAGFYMLLTVAVIPAIALSLLGMSYSEYVQPIAFFAAGLTAAAFFYFLAALPRNLFHLLKQKSNWFKLYLMAFLVSFILKIILQSLSVFSIFKSFAFENKPIVIAYLHLSLIGSVSFLFLALLIEKKWITVNMPVKIGSVLLIAGFIITELVLVLSGLGVYNIHIILEIGSMAMLLGIALLIFSKNHKTVCNETA